MRKNIRWGDYKLEILDPGEEVLTFRDSPAALIFLRRFKNDPVTMGILRETVITNFPSAWSLDAEEVLERFSLLLVSGKVSVLRALEPLGGGSAGEDSQKQTGQAAKGPTPAKKSWIEIRLVDSEGNPIPGEKYSIKLPDGSLEDGNLDSYGHAEYYEINPGTCVVGFPGLEDDEWDRI